mgnify:CR=1 FL=1
MIKLTVEQILSSIDMLSAAEQEELIACLPTILKRQNSIDQSTEGQLMTNTLGDVQVSGSAAFNYQPSQAGGNINASASFAQGISAHQELLQALLSLKESIQSAESLPELSKIGAATQVDQLAIEAQKVNPDKNLIGRTISALKQGLKGVTDLAGPVANVASLVAKAWGVPV